jgi:hypothetical protein
MSNVNMNMIKYAKFSLIGVVAMIFGQASTGLSQNSANTADSHMWTAQLGLVLCLLTAVFVMLSKTEDSKLKGMSWGLFGAWVIQYGLGEMYSGGMDAMSFVHAMIAMAILLHAMALLRSFPKDMATDTA